MNVDSVPMCLAAYDIEKWYCEVMHLTYGQFHVFDLKGDHLAGGTWTRYDLSREQEYKDL